MTTLREAAQQALEALEDVDGPITALLGSLLGSPDADAPGAKVRTAITALRAALAQQDEPHPDYPCRSDGRCQYAIDHGAEGLGSCPKGKCAIAQPQPAEDRAVAQDNLRVMREMFGEQAEPLNLRDPAVQKRLATQWGYVPAAQQAEPVEPVAGA